MDMQGSRALAVTQQQAWDALNDPEVLKLCIPGCDKVEVTGPNQYTVGMAVRVGPVSSRFTGKIALSELNPPQSYTLAFDGQGGVAGFGRGKAQVKLAQNDTGCELSYTVNAQVGGKIAQVGQRLIDGVARSMADDFFRRFDDEMKRRYPSATPAEAAAVEAPMAVARSGIPMWVWVLSALVLIAIVWSIMR